MGKDQQRNLGDPAAWRKLANARGECITLGRRGRESDRRIVAAKRVTTVERRGRSRDMRSQRRGEPLG